MNDIKVIQEIESLTKSIPLVHKTATFAATNKIELLRTLIQALVILVDEIGNGNGAATSRSVTLAEDVQKFETNLICNALRQTRGNQKQVSILLGIKQSTLNEKIKRYGIDPKLFMLTGVHLQDQAAFE